EGQDQNQAEEREVTRGKELCEKFHLRYRALKRKRAKCLALVAESGRVVAVDSAAQAVELENDREPDSDLRRSNGDDEEGERLAHHVARVESVEGDEQEIHAVQHELYAHELN